MAASVTSLNSEFALAEISLLKLGSRLFVYLVIYFFISCENDKLTQVAS